jgi:hypothetical protein
VLCMVGDGRETNRLYLRLRQTASHKLHKCEKKG